MLLIAAGSSATAQEQPQKLRTLSGDEIRDAESRLSELGYWTGPVDGVFDGASGQALMAFQKIEGRRRTGKLNFEEMEALRKARRPEPRERGYWHVEVDLGRQVLFVVETDGQVSAILPISSGNGELFTEDGWARQAITPPGRFTVYRKIEGWRKGPLGLMFYPSYIVGGVAIHGSLLVPPSPASHGCIRIPMFAAKEFFKMTPIGTVILVYDDGMAE